MADASDARNECQPLLSIHDSGEVGDPVHIPSKARFTARLLALQFLTLFAYFHLLAPKLKLLELTICRTYFEKHDPTQVRTQPDWPWYEIDERECKAKDIQRQLSSLKSLIVFLDGLCSTYAGTRVWSR
jgi:hypothetical protein